MPEISPVEVSIVRPSGRLPDDIDHVAPKILASSFALYCWPYVPSGRLVVVIASVVVGSGSLTVIVRSFSAVAVPSAALTLKDDSPAVVGVPEIVPKLLRFSPAGSVPETNDHVAPETLASRLAEYGSFTVPEGRLVVVIAIVDGGVALMVMVNCFSAPV